MLHRESLEPLPRRTNVKYNRSRTRASGSLKHDTDSVSFLPIRITGFTQHSMKPCQNYANSPKVGSLQETSTTSVKSLTPRPY
jgi:hypothetical protein